MKARLTMRAALMLRMPAVALGLGRLRRMHCALLARAGQKAGRGNLFVAGALLAVYVVTI